jgi:hypothetical protein
MNSTSDDVLLLITKFMVAPKDFIALRATCKKLRDSLPALIGTNLENFISSAEELRGTTLKEVSSSV